MDIGLILGVFIHWPALALLPALLFALLFLSRRRGIVAIAALGWLAYFPYEWGMKSRLLCSGECNIRVDLLLFYPLLMLLSFRALLAVSRSRRPPSRD